LQLRLDRAVVVAAGDHFIVRRPSPSQTLGGGTVLNPHPRRRWRRFDPAVTARLRVLAQGTPEEIVAQALARHPYGTAAQIGEGSGLDVEEAATALAGLIDQGAAVRLPGTGEPVLLLLEEWFAMRDSLLMILGEYHGSHPLRRGMPRSEVRSRFGLGPRRAVGERSGHDAQLPLRVFNALVVSLMDAGVVLGDDQALWRTDFTVQLTAVQATAVERTLAKLAAAGLMPPTADEVLGLLGGDQALLELLVDEGRLVRVGPALIYRREEFDTLTASARARLQEQGQLTLAEARDLWNVSRKVAQAVLEEMDARRMTRREGDFRVSR
jgi:selenocysteine-specific elongation factor